MSALFFLGCFVLERSACPRPLDTARACWDWLAVWTGTRWELKLQSSSCNDFQYLGPKTRCLILAGYCMILLRVSEVLHIPGRKQGQMPIGCIVVCTHKACTQPGMILQHSVLHQTLDAQILIIRGRSGFGISVPTLVMHRASCPGWSTRVLASLAPLYVSTPAG